MRVPNTYSTGREAASGVPRQPWSQTVHGRLAAMMAFAGMSLGGVACDADGNKPNIVNDTDTAADVTPDTTPDVSSDSGITVPDTVTPDAGSDTAPDILPPVPALPVLDNTGPFTVLPGESVTISGHVNPAEAGNVETIAAKLTRPNGGEVPDVAVDYDATTGRFSVDITSEVADPALKLSFAAVSNVSSTVISDWTDPVLVEVPPVPEAPALAETTKNLDIQDPLTVTLTNIPKGMASFSILDPAGNVLFGDTLAEGETEHTAVIPFEGEYFDQGKYQVTLEADTGLQSQPTGFEVAYNAPEIGNLKVDCSGTWDMCGSAGLVYPVTFDAKNVVSADAYDEAVPGSCDPVGCAVATGAISAVSIGAGIGTFQYTTGIGAGAIIRLTVTAKGVKDADMPDGGVKTASESVEFQLY